MKSSKKENNDVVTLFNDMNDILQQLPPHHYGRAQIILLQGEIDEILNNNSKYLLFNNFFLNHINIIYFVFDILIAFFKSKDYKMEFNIRLQMPFLYNKRIIKYIYNLNKFCNLYLHVNNVIQIDISHNIIMFNTHIYDFNTLNELKKLGIVNMNFNLDILEENFFSDDFLSGLESYLNINYKIKIVVVCEDSQFFYDLYKNKLTDNDSESHKNMLHQKVFIKYFKNLIKNYPFLKYSTIDISTLNSEGYFSITIKGKKHLGHNKKYSVKKSKPILYNPQKSLKKIQNLEKQFENNNKKYLLEQSNS